MSISAKKIRPLASTLLCITLAVPARTFAESQPVVQVPDAASRAVVGPPATMAQPQLLEEKELQELSARNQEPDPELRGGALSNEHLTYIVIALAAAVLVLVLK